MVEITTPEKDDTTLPLKAWTDSAATCKGARAKVVHHIRLGIQP